MNDAVLPDPTPFLPPGVEKPKRPKASDFARLGRSRRYKEIEAYCEARKAYWRHFTPDGEAFVKMVVENPDAALRYAAIAASVIGEIDDLQYRIVLEAGK